MRLCFGSFATVLACCRQDIHINQQSFISKLVKAVDPKSTYLDDKSAVSKLLMCQKNFSFADKEKAKRPILDTVIRELETEVTPFIEEDKKAKVILTLLGIIQNDSYIDTEKQQTFKMYFGMDKQELFHQSEFILSDFLGRVLLYTVCGNIDNTENEINKDSIKEIISDYISNIAKPYMNDYQWDMSTQTLTLSFIKIYNIFNIAMSKYQIKDFIMSHAAPASSDYSWMRKINSPWVVKCDSFHEFVENNIIVPFAQSTHRADIMLKTIQQFTLVLTEYSSFLKSTLPPINLSDHNSFNPSLWEEYQKWSLYYTEQTQNYVQQLRSIYQEICNYASPCYIQESK